MTPRGAIRFWMILMILCFAPMVNLFEVNSPPQAAASVIDDAKKEGRVVWYCSTTNETNQAMRRSFEEKYPLIKVEIMRDAGSRLNTRVIAEARAQRHIWDVLSCSGFNLGVLMKENLFAKYNSPERAAVPERFKDREGYWTALYLNPVVTGYNTRHVSLKEAPRNWNDLLDPKWKGKMNIDFADVEWFANMMKLKGEKEWLEFMRKLSAQDLILMTGHSLEAQMLAAGEFHIGVNLYAYQLESMKEQGAPVDWVALDPAITYFFPCAISAKAPHANAARVFQDFLLSREGQRVLAGFGRLPSRSDIPPKFPRMVYKWQASDVTLVEDFLKYQKQYLDLIKKR